MGHTIPYYIGHSTQTSVIHRLFTPSHLRMFSRLCSWLIIGRHIMLLVSWLVLELIKFMGRSVVDPVARFIVVSVCV